jgi:hypothetical protein
MLAHVRQQAELEVERAEGSYTEARRRVEGSLLEALRSGAADPLLEPARALHVAQGNLDWQETRKRMRRLEGIVVALRREEEEKETRAAASAGSQETLSTDVAVVAARVSPITPGHAGAEDGMRRLEEEGVVVHDSVLPSVIMGRS